MEFQVNPPDRQDRIKFLVIAKDPFLAAMLDSSVHHATAQTEACGVIKQMCVSVLRQLEDQTYGDGEGLWLGLQSKPRL